jgi:hypothetical protein
LRLNFILIIPREGDRLFEQATGQSKFELFAEGEKNTFLKLPMRKSRLKSMPPATANQLTLHQVGTGHASATDHVESIVMAGRQERNDTWKTEIRA